MFIFSSRGFTEDDFEKVASFFDRAVTITQTIATKTGDVSLYIFQYPQHKQATALISNAHIPPQALS